MNYKSFLLLQKETLNQCFNFCCNQDLCFFWLDFSLHCHNCWSASIPQVIVAVPKIVLRAVFPGTVLTPAPAKDKQKASFCQKLTFSALVIFCWFLFKTLSAKNIQLFIRLFNDKIIYSCRDVKSKIVEVEIENASINCYNNDDDDDLL